MSENRSAAELRDALESALVANPDDLTAHSAYADFLTEQGDQRGELISVQLALEQASGSERDRLAKREAALLAQLQSADEGLVGVVFRDRDDITCRFRRGWLDDIQVHCMRADLAEELAGSAELRLLRRLAVVNPDAPELDRAEAYRTHVLAGIAWFEPEEEEALEPLRSSLETWANLRVFQLGDATHERCDVGDGPIADLIENMPHLEELYLFLWQLDEAERIFSLPLPHLRVLHVGGVFDYPLSALAANDSLGKLEELLLQPAAPDGHNKLFPDVCIELVQSPHLTALRHLRLCFILGGDNVCSAIAEGGHLARLRTLELQYSQITDDGAAALAGSPDLARLERLDLVGNHISDEGIARLKATGVNLVWEPQVPEEEEQGEEVDDEDPEV
jgi:uncharacterized protein (TIGR02996 family)